MKTSESPQNVKTARRRSAVSFAAAVALYLPVIAFVFYAAPVLTYKAAATRRPSLFPLRRSQEVLFLKPGPSPCRRNRSLSPNP